MSIEYNEGYAEGYDIGYDAGAFNMLDRMVLIGCALGVAVTIGMIKYADSLVAKTRAECARTSTGVIKEKVEYVSPSVKCTYPKKPTRELPCQAWKRV